MNNPDEGTTPDQAIIKKSTGAENRKTSRQRATDVKRAREERELEKRRAEKKLIKEINMYVLVMHM